VQHIGAHAAAQMDVAREIPICVDVCADIGCLNRRIDALIPGLVLWNLQQVLRLVDMRGAKRKAKCEITSDGAPRTIAARAMRERRAKAKVVVDLLVEIPAPHPIRHRARALGVTAEVFARVEAGKHHPQANRGSRTARCTSFD
jgi:hypothetical protein